MGRAVRRRCRGRPGTQSFHNGFKLQWEAFAGGGPYRWDAREGAKGVQLVVSALRSWEAALLGRCAEFARSVGAEADRPSAPDGKG